MSGPKETPVPRTAKKAVQISRNALNRDWISGSQIKAGIPQGFSKLVLLYQKGRDL